MSTTKVLMKASEVLKQISAINIVDVADRHIVRFTNMLSSNSPNVRVGECEQYLEIWQSVKRKGGDIEKLTRPEKTELLHAFFDGGYAKEFGKSADDFEWSEDEDDDEE